MDYLLDMVDQDVVKGRAVERRDDLCLEGDDLAVAFAECPSDIVLRQTRDAHHVFTHRDPVQAKVASAYPPTSDNAYDNNRAVRRGALRRACGAPD
jgi:hypothetical protein